MKRVLCGVLRALTAEVGAGVFSKKTPASTIWNARRRARAGPVMAAPHYWTRALTPAPARRQAPRPGGCRAGVASPPPELSSFLSVRAETARAHGKGSRAARSGWWRNTLYGKPPFISPTKLKIAKKIILSLILPEVNYISRKLKININLNMRPYNITYSEVFIYIWISTYHNFLVSFSVQLFFI